MAERFSEGSIEAMKQPHREMVVKLDKWLWVARFFKTRPLAREAIQQGQVLYNNGLVKPTQEISLGASVDICQPRFRKTVIITGLSTRRRNCEESWGLYEETQPESVSNENKQPFTRPRSNPEFVKNS